MSGEDLELQMPSEIRGNRHEESKPFLSAVLDQQADVDQPRRKGILRFTVDVPPGSSRQRVVQPRPPPRWRTPEFYLYYLIFAITVPVMVWKPIQLSKGEAALSSSAICLLRKYIVCSRDTSQLPYL